MSDAPSELRQFEFEFEFLIYILLALDNKNIKSTIHSMKPVKQEDGLGCGVASTAFILQVTYQEALKMFVDGKRRVKEEANFYCPEITNILKKSGLKYAWKKLPKNVKESDIPNLSIVFVTQSKTLPFGHFLAKYNDKWMDPWINLPYKDIKAGFRDELPGKPTYVIHPYLGSISLMCGFIHKE